MKKKTDKTLLIIWSQLQLLSHICGLTQRQRERRKIKRQNVICRFKYCFIFKYLLFSWLSHCSLTNSWQIYQPVITGIIRELISGHSQELTVYHVGIINLLPLVISVFPDSTVTPSNVLFCSTNNSKQNIFKCDDTKERKAENVCYHNTHTNSVTSSVWSSTTYPRVPSGFKVISVLQR